MPTRYNPTHDADTTILGVAEPQSSQTAPALRNPLDLLPPRLVHTLALLRDASDAEIVATVDLLGLGSRTALTLAGAITMDTNVDPAKVALTPVMRELVASIPQMEGGDDDVDIERARLEEFARSGYSNAATTASSAGAATPQTTQATDRSLQVPGAGAQSSGFRSNSPHPQPGRRVGGSPA